MGQTVRVLFENPKDDFWPGYTDNYIRVISKDSRDLTNKMAMVTLTSVEADFVEGDIVEILEPSLISSIA